MEQFPQIYMRYPDISKISELRISDGFELVTHKNEYEKAWEMLIERAFHTSFTFDKCIICGRCATPYHPEHTLYIKYQDRLVATVTAIEHADFPGEGWFRMVASDPEFRGKGLGKQVCLAALHSLAKRGYKTAVLCTDDDRIPAIKTYLSLGFEPVYIHESHRDRWERIYMKIGTKNT